MTLTGANGFLRGRALGELLAAFVREYGDTAVEQLDGEEATAEQMRAALESLPFLTPRKLVVLREPGKQKAFCEHIDATLDALSDTTDLIIVEPKLDKRLSYYKMLKKRTDFREFGELDAAGLAAWAAAYVKERGGELAAGEAQLLVDRLGTNQSLLQNELDKLLLYNPKITAATIGLLTERLPQSTVFELLDAAFSGKTARALALYQEQRALRVEPLAIVAMLAWQMHILALVKAAGERSPDEIARQAKLSPFVVRKTQAIARKLSAQQVKMFVADLLALDIRLKTTALDPDEALQAYLLKIAL